MLAIPWQHFLEPGSEKLVLIGSPVDDNGKFLSIKPLLDDSPDGLNIVSVDAIERCSREMPSRNTAAYLFLDGGSLAADSARKNTRRQDLEQTLGDACRLFPHQLLVELQHLPSDWSADPLYAFGFRRVASPPESAVFEFRLSEYKTPPAWLNARYWAHPERYATDSDPDQFSDLTGSFDDTMDETLDEESD